MYVLQLFFVYFYRSHYINIVQLQQHNRYMQNAHISYKIYLIYALLIINIKKKILPYPLQVYQ